MYGFHEYTSRHNIPALKFPLHDFLASRIFLAGTMKIYAGKYAFSIQGEKTYLNDREVLVIGLRCSNALKSDPATHRLIRSKRGRR